MYLELKLDQDFCQKGDEVSLLSDFNSLILLIHDGFSMQVWQLNFLLILVMYRYGLVPWRLEGGCYQVHK